MTRDEAKTILQSCRPGGPDAHDPFFADALALAQTDAELAAWFADQQKFDAQFSHALKNVEVPFALKKNLLALENEAATAAPPFGWWRHLFSWRSPATWAMAAGCVLIFAGLALLRSPDNRFADFQTAMISASGESAHHVDVLNSNFSQVQNWLAGHDAQTNIDLPAGMHSGLMGCRVLDWHSRKVSMLCFQLNGSKHVDLFIAALGKVAGTPAAGQPQFTQNGARATASWDENGRTYLMTGDVDENFLRHCLQPAPTANARLPMVLSAARSRNYFLE